MEQSLKKPVARVNDVFNISEAGKFLGNEGLGYDLKTRLIYTC